MGKLTLILGGARSGKSTYAEKLAKEIGGDWVLYVATSEAKDEEMRERIEKHRAARPVAWITVEAPRSIAQVIVHARCGEEVVLVDCITVLVSNILLAESRKANENPFNVKVEEAVNDEVTQLLRIIHQTKGHFLLVSNEVGMGLVPPYALGRAYRDLLGRANQRLTEAADDVFFLVAGLPMQMK
ncbi:MAG: bifunctional adenosylcobinamide kinase/adenosylcobinamide-phosphate guanylyltransferase [Anaerolineae bacterium]|jgi:adenosylcobinamide kinase / adenosylcobinamide-phosphate guanylyltransferase|nr:bifunctional adenosylcobinamide kinase/adenosylcobinamide-phosphate guanylyltransferase [Anaerolineae bacterium]